MTRSPTAGPGAASFDILLVDDDATSMALLDGIVAEFGRARCASSGEAALELARERTPDLILLDAQMQGMSGFQVCETLKADRALADVPVIFVTGHDESWVEVAGLEAGAVDFIGKPVHAPVVRARVRTQLKLKQTADELRHRSAQDAITAVASRRAFDEALQREWLRCRRAGEPLALLLVAVDALGRYAERLGAGPRDACLRAVAAALNDALLRPADALARYDDEHFALLLPVTDAAGAQHVAQRALDAVERLAIAHPASPVARHVTLSIGVATYDATSPSWTGPSVRRGAQTGSLHTADDLLQAARKALGDAQRAGCAQSSVLDIGDAYAR